MSAGVEAPLASTSWHDQVMPTLASCVGDLDRFAKLHWGQTPLHVRNVDGQLAALLTVDAVDQIVNSGLRWPAVRMVERGTVVAPERYCSQGRIGHLDIELLVDPGKVLDRYRAGSTLVLQSLHRTWPPLGEMTDQLQREIGHRTQANAYLTPAGSHGFGKHADDHDVLVIHTHGRKHWTVDGLGDIELEPGAVLYMPRGTPHRADTSADVSLHITIGIHPVTARQVLLRALSHLDLTEALPLGFHRLTDDDLARAVGGMIERSASALDGVSVAAVAEATCEAGRRMLNRRSSQGRLREAVLRPSVTAASRARIVDASWTIEVRRDRVVLSSDRGALYLPATTLAALRCLIDAGPAGVDIASLPGLDPHSRLVLARRLLDEGEVELAAVSRSSQQH